MKTDTDAARPRDKTDLPVTPALPTPVAAPGGAARRRWRGFVLAVVLLALIWGVLTEFRVDAWVFGVPAVLAGAALVLLMPARPGWRLSPAGLLGFMLWFAVQSVRGAADVARRAMLPDMALRPGFRRYRPRLPQGAPRVLFLNSITLLPGTLSAEIAGDGVVVHMLDTRADLDAELGALEARVAAMFGLASGRAAGMQEGNE